MVKAISFLWLKGWHAPAGRRTCETPASSQADQTGCAGGCQKTWDPAGRSFRRTARAASADSEVRPGPRAPDPTPPPGHRRGSRARSTIHTLPAESARLIAAPLWRAAACRLSTSGRCRFRLTAGLTWSPATRRRRAAAAGMRRRGWNPESRAGHDSRWRPAPAVSATGRCPAGGDPDIGILLGFRYAPSLSRPVCTVARPAGNR